MNYAKALAASLSDNSDIGIIQSQAQLELKRDLSQAEKNLLASKFSLKLIAKRIEKVGN